MEGLYWSIAGFLLLLETCEAMLPCPPPSEKCDCQNAAEGLVQCTGATTLPFNLPENVTVLNMDSNTLGSVLLPTQMNNVGNLSLTQLYLSNTGLRAIANRAFVSQPNIRTLDLSNNEFTRLDGQIFYNLLHLKHLFLAKSSIHEITSLVFVYTPELEYLDLGQNMLKMISNEFVSLSELKTLLLSSNQVNTIADNALENQRLLEHLDLSGNQLITPEKDLFAHLVKNNGTLALALQDKNQWACCGPKAFEYRVFFNGLPMNINSRYEYNVICETPKKFIGSTIGNIDQNDLESTQCGPPENTTTTEPNVVTREITHQPGQSSTAKASTTGNSPQTTGGGGVTMPEPYKNSLHDLSDGLIALIFIVTIILVAVITALIVHQCHVKKNKKDFNDFVRNLPNTMEADTDEEAGVTTKTYRHDAPVYGSTGNVVDRHKNESSSSATNYAYDTPKPLNKKGSRSSSSPGSQKRKPPPYDPPPTSPEGFDQAYAQTQFNNSSSVGLDFTMYQRSFSTGFYDFEYESDASDDLWDVKNVR